LDRIIKDETTPPRAQEKAVVDIMRDLFEDTLLAVYLHGSAVSGGLQPQSDIDFLVVIDRPMAMAQRRSLLRALLSISGHHPARPNGPRCIEVMVFEKSDLALPKFPARAEFIYGEWLRNAFEAGEIPMPVRDPEITLVLAQARDMARPVFGPRAIELLPEIAPQHVRRAIRDALPALLDGLRGDERNVLLTLARMWRTATTGEFVSKDVAATWALHRMPEHEAGILAYAREAYVGRVEDNWRNLHDDVRQTAAHLHQRLSMLL
jgi:predicted nucleotidyltransferase